MSEPHVVTRNAPAGANYSDSVGLVVYETNAGEATLAPNATVQPLGVILSADDVAAGRVSVCTHGRCKAKYNGVITLGTTLWCQADSGGSGELVANANDGYAVGYTLATVDTVANEYAEFYVDIQSDIFGVANNATDIATNAAGIATNVTDIATNTANVATNTAGIATNVTDIATNTAGIATNVTNIATNVTNIATNAGDITAAANQLAVLPSQIQTGTHNTAASAADWPITMPVAMPSTDYNVHIHYVSGFNDGASGEPASIGTWKVGIGSTTEFVVSYVDNTDAGINITNLTFNWTAIPR